MSREAVRLAADRVTDQGYFGQMNEAQLDSAYAPPIWSGATDQLTVYKNGLSLRSEARVHGAVLAEPRSAQELRAMKRVKRSIS